MAVCVIISFRAAQLGDSFPEGVDTVEAIQTICKTLMQEGFDHISTSYTVTKYMEERLAAVFEPDTVLPANLVHYHCLLKRTGGKNKWTLKRETGESRVTPYIPLLLWACKAKMTADVCFDGQEIVRDHVGLAEGSTGLPFFLNSELLTPTIKLVPLLLAHFSGKPGFGINARTSYLHHHLTASFYSH